MNIYSQALGGISGGRVLDIATGEGEFIKTLVRNLKSYGDIIGIDIHKCNKSPGTIFDVPNIYFYQMNAGMLGFKGECFDTLSISSSLHHLENTHLCFSQMKRVLKSRGTLIIRETHRDAQTEPQRIDMDIHHWVADIDSALGFTHNKTYSRNELIELAEYLDLSMYELYDVSNLEMDPMDGAAIKLNEDIIDRYIRLASRLPDSIMLKERGEKLRQRLRNMGVQWEPELIIVGKKQ